MPRTLPACPSFPETRRTLVEEMTQILTKTRKRIPPRDGVRLGAERRTATACACDAGASLIELVLALGILGVLTAIGASLLLQTFASVERRMGSSALFDNGVTALNRMSREIRMAGYPSAKTFSALDITASPGLAATPFITVTSYDLVFQADIDGDGTVEQIEYVLPTSSSSLLRNVTRKNSNGSLAASTLSSVAAVDVQNQLTHQPLFSWDVDPASAQPFPLNVRTVYINLILQTPANSTGTTNMTLLATCPRMNF